MVLLAYAVLGAGTGLVTQAVITHMHITDSAIQDALIVIAHKEFPSTDEAYSKRLADDRGRYAAAHKTLWVDGAGLVVRVYVLANYGIFNRMNGQWRAGTAQPLIIVLRLDGKGNYVYSYHQGGRDGINWLPEGWPWWLKSISPFIDYSDDFYQKQIDAYLE